MDYTKISKSIHRHPRILFTLKEIEDTKKMVLEQDQNKMIRFKDIANQIYKRADSYVSEEKFIVHYPSIQINLTIPLPLKQLKPVPEPKGYVDFPFWTMYSRAIEERIKLLSFSYGMTKKEDYAKKIKEYLLALCKFERWYEFPHRGAEGNLSNAHFTLAVSIGYDAIYHNLSIAEKKMIQEAILIKGLVPFEIDFKNEDNHNIIASKQVAMLIGSLSIMDEVDVEKFFKNSYTYLSSYLDNRLTSPEIEGLLYTNVAARHVLMAADILNRATGLSTLIQHQYFEEFLPDLFFYMLVNNDGVSFANFSDSFYHLDLAYIMGMLSYNNRNPVASWYVHHCSPTSQDIMMHMKEVIPPISPDRYYKQNSKVFPSIGWASFRSGWQSDDHVIAFTSSESAKDHNHFDQNNFILNVAGEWLLTNPGYQDYVEGPRREFTLGTIGHNAMLVNGNGQTNRGRSNITKWYTSEQFDFLIADATRAYKNSIALWERKVLHIDKTYFIMIDHVVKNKEDDAITFLYHTTSSISVGLEIKHPGDEFLNNQIDIKGEQAEVSLYTIYPTVTNKKVEIYPGAEEYGSFLQIEPKENSLDQYFVCLLQPKASLEKLGHAFDCKVTKKGDQLELEIYRPDQDITDYLLVNENSIKVTSKKCEVEIPLKN